MIADPFSDGLALLVVEDDDVLRETMRECMVMDGYAVDVSATLDEATASLAARAPAILIVDLMLPDGRAESLLETVRALGPRRPITVIVSAAIDAAEVARRYDVPLLKKPIDLEELSEFVAREVARRSNASAAA